MLKQWITKIATLYAANGKFHAFVKVVLVGLGTGASSAFIGGIPADKKGWLVAGGIVLGTVEAGISTWLRNRALASVQGMAATPEQAPAVAAAKDQLAEAAAASTPTIVPGSTK